MVRRVALFVNRAEDRTEWATIMKHDDYTVGFEEQRARARVRKTLSYYGTILDGAFQ